MTTRRDLERRLSDIEASTGHTEMILYEDDAGRLYDREGGRVDRDAANPVVVLQR